MGNNFYDRFISRFILMKKEEGLSADQTKRALIDVLKRMQDLQPKDKDVLSIHISLLESMVLKSKLAGDLNDTKKWKESEVRKKYIVLFQGNAKAKKKDIKSIAFGPFGANVADWKMSLLRKRTSGIENSLLYNSDSIVVCSRDYKTFHFKSSSNRSKVPTFGFILFDEKSMPSDEGMKICSGLELKKWDSFISPELKKHWDFDYISEVLGSFVAHH